MTVMSDVDGVGFKAKEATVKSAALRFSVSPGSLNAPRVSLVFVEMLVDARTHFHGKEM